MPHIAKHEGLVPPTMTKSYASRPLRSAKSYKNLALALKVSNESRKKRMFGLDWLSHREVLIFQIFQ